MSDRTAPLHVVRYTMSPQAGVLTLRNLTEFADRLRALGVESMLDRALTYRADNRSFYVEGTLPESLPDASEEPPAEADYRRENELLNACITRIRRHYDDWDANRIGQGTLRERMKAELTGLRRKTSES